MTPFIISDESVLQLRKLLDRTPNVKPDQGIRIYISGLCNGGPEWSLTLDTFQPEFDECCEFDGLKVIVERELLNAVGGLNVQYEAIDEDGGFLITALDPEVQALYGGGCSGNCSSCHGCHSCHGGCHDHCSGDCSNCSEDCCHGASCDDEPDEGIGYNDDDE